MAEDVNERQALFSKDASGTEVGGHLTAFVENGQVKVRLQSTTAQQWLSSDPGTIVDGQEHQLAITFGAMGFQMYLDGELVGSRTDFTQGLDTNNEQLAIGANIWGRSEENPLYARNEFAGVITDFTVYDHQLSAIELSGALDPLLADSVEVNRDLAFTDASEESNNVDRLFEDADNRLFEEIKSLLSLA